MIKVYNHLILTAAIKQEASVGEFQSSILDIHLCARVCVSVYVPCYLLPAIVYNLIIFFFPYSNIIF